MNKLSEFFKNHKKVVMISATVLALAVIGTVVMLTGGLWKAGDGEATALPASNIYPTARATADSVNTPPATSVPKTTAAAATKTTEKENTTTKPSTTAPSSTAPDGTVPFATAIAPDTPADYQTQWDAGYLVAIDNPDYTYSCYHISLTDEDRDLLERLCYGEFGSGGFIGAAMIAQCVRDAMCFDGYSTVEDVIKYCRYDGSTTSGTSDECVQAVRYIFDDDGSAVQHRMLYMYNPYMVKSAFHESQNFILSYQGVRFFDRFGY
ncbi:hypothetical protein [Ruminococcus sp. JE7B6]|uniref:hypothetical protein n=1 Tax=Ruminococcus sp. JE7B6 TaxID=3233380 RepID=UPI00389A7D95